MPTALITGASSGFGAEFARQLARERYKLILVARRTDRLQAVAREALSMGAPEAHVVRSDLGHSDAPQRLGARVQELGLEVDYLVNNAGFGTHGRFERLALERELEQIDVNVRAPAALARIFLPAMVKRRHGTIINVASTAAFQPMPFMATYGATKAFVLSFSHALAEELRGTGVTVTALCPGPVRTEFQQVAGIGRQRLPSLAFMEPKAVVARAIAAAKRGKPIVITGVVNLAMAQSVRFAPRALVTRITGAIFREHRA